jgi:hypothetical protein
MSMFDINSLPIPGGFVVAFLIWAALAGFVFGPVVGDRTMIMSGWQTMCEQSLHAESASHRSPQIASKPKMSCDQMMGLFSDGADTLCDRGGDLLFDLLNTDPLARQKAQLRQREENRLARTASLAPTRCSCAASIVGSDRISWGVYAGTARLAGGPSDLQADLIKALHSPSCALNVGS